MWTDTKLIDSKFLNNTNSDVLVSKFLDGAAQPVGPTVVNFGFDATNQSSYKINDVVDLDFNIDFNFEKVFSIVDGKLYAYNPNLITFKFDSAFEIGREHSIKSVYYFNFEVYPMYLDTDGEDFYDHVDNNFSYFYIKSQNYPLNGDYIAYYNLENFLEADNSTEIGGYYDSSYILARVYNKNYGDALGNWSQDYASTSSELVYPQSDTFEKVDRKSVV